MFIRHRAAVDFDGLVNTADVSLLLLNFGQVTWL